MVAIGYTKGVRTVAGRTGDVTLSVTDISGAAASTDVSAEAATRAAADSSEATARAAGDAATLSSANAHADSAVASEATARAAADSAEATARAAADAALVPQTRQVIAGTGLTGGGALSADRTLAVAYGTTAGTAAQGNDSRIVGAVQHGELVLNVKDYGAKGDGTTDDTAAIQSAINAVATSAGAFAITTSNRGGTVYLPPARYRVTGQITLAPGVTLRGAGPNATVLVNEGTTNHVLYFQGAVGGLITPVGLQHLAVAQKSGVTHTGGAAVYIDGGGHGATVAMYQVVTNGTAYGVWLRDTYVSSISRVEAYSHVNGFHLDALCTSIAFSGCYAAACSDSGYKIFGNYLSFSGCASDSNAKDGYEVYYNSGSAVSIAFLGCGAEQFGRYGISSDRASGITIQSPRLIASPSASSAIWLTGGSQFMIAGPVLSCTAANASPAIDNNNSSGAYPLGLAVLGLSSATNYASLVSNEIETWWVGDYTTMGLSPAGLRIGPTTSFTEALQSLFVGSTPAGSGGSAYGIYSAPVATQSLTTFAGITSQPVENASGQSISRIIDFFAPGPVRSAGSLQRTEGVRIADHSAGVTANANIAMGATVPLSGNWNIYAVSTLLNFFAGALVLGTTTGPTISAGSGSPESVVTAPVGSLYLRSDGGTGTSHYVKESGTGNTGWIAK